jgi:hypothetical protein
MPPQDRVGRDDRGEVGQGSASQPVPMHGEPTSFVVAEPQTPPTQLSPQDSILFDHVGQTLLLPAAHPAGENSE